MSLIVTVYVNDGIVMASDSRTTLKNITTNGTQTIQTCYPLSDTTFKTFLCNNKCGISVCGDASYDNRPIAGLIENFIQTKLSQNTLITEMPQMLLDFFDKKDSDRVSIFHICGYETTELQIIQHAYLVVTGPNKSIKELTSQNVHGAFWNGKIDTLTKLLKNQIINPQFICVDNLSLSVNGTPVVIP